jgi:hypothetical protein
MLVSILIPTLLERLSTFAPMVEDLYKQIKDNKLEDKVEIISICDNRTIPLVEKRNHLQKLARGKYFTHLDDDDNFASDYCKTVVDHIESLEKDVDIIAYDQKCFVKDDIFILEPHGNAPINLIQEHKKYDLKAFYRFPWQFHLFHKRFIEVYRTESDSPDKKNKPALCEDRNWIKKIQLENPDSMSIIKDYIGHEYHFEDPSKTTSQ